MTVREANLTELLEYTISQPPCSAGQRLKSQKELAGLFGVPETAVRKSLSELIRKGILTSRRGSGTYVRRISKVTETPVDPTPLPAPAELFHEVTQSHQLSQMNQKARTQLRLGLWLNMHQLSQTSAKIMAAITSALAQRGHRLTINPLSDNSRDDYSQERVNQMIQENPADGYLVEGHNANLFQALDKNNLPVVFYLSGRLEVKYEPMVMLNTEEATERGVRILIEAGWRKIGLLGLKVPTHMREYEHHDWNSYDNVMKKAGLEYRSAALIEDRENNFTQIINKLEAYFQTPEAPEAVYVSDDHLMAALDHVLRSRGLLPGRDLGVITLSNRDIGLPGERQWSTMEFDLDNFAHLVVDNLLYRLQNAGMRPHTVAQYATWVPEGTHQRP